MLLHTKLNNGQMYFRDIPIDFHDLYNKCLSPQVMYCSKEIMSIVLKLCLGTWSASSVLVKKFNQLPEGIEIINTILQCCQSFSALSTKCAYST